MTSLPYHDIKWGEWPFPKDRVVTLHWVQSPFMDPTSHQWRTKAVFLDGSNLVDIEVSWGALPLLRCGHNYRDGLLLRNVGSTPKVINLRHEPLVSNEEAGPAIPRSLLSLQTRTNLAERCWVFSSDGQKVVIPVVEGIRALVAPTRYLALHCLEPAFLNEAVRRYRLDGDRLLIEFSDEIPLSLINNGMVLHLARLLLQPDFRSAWDAVYFCMRQSGSARSSSSKVDLPMPKLTRMVVLGYISSNTLLVREILQAEAAFLPLTKIVWLHPRLEKEGEVLTSKWRRVRVPEQRLEMDRFAAASGGAPLRLDALPVLGGKQNIKIHRIITPSRTRKWWKQIAGPRLKFAFSLGDVGTGVKRPSADIVLERPVPDAWPTPQPEDGLGDFLSALRWLRNLFDGPISVSVVDCPGNTAFFRIEDRKRKVANVRLFWPTGQNVTILEFGRPDFHSISTLIFKGDINEDGLQELCRDELSPNGSWNRKALSDELGDGCFYLLRHGQRLDDQWARLILTRAKEVAG